MKTYAVLLLSIFYIFSGCTKSATTKSPANNSEIGTLTVSVDIVNKKIITGKDFEVKISATETITPWQDVSVQIDADNSNLISLRSNSCIIQYTTKSCTLIATALATGSAKLTVSAKNFKGAEYAFTVVPHNTVSIKTNLEDNTAIVSEGFTITVIANDPILIEEKTTFNVKAKEPELISVTPSSCDISPGQNQCTVQAIAIKKSVDKTSIEVSAKDFITESYGSISISDLHKLTLSTDIPVNNTTLKDKNFNIISTLDHANNTNGDVVVTIDNKSPNIIKLDSNSCTIKSGDTQCKIGAHGIESGSGEVTATATHSKPANLLKIKSVNRDTVSIITSFPDFEVPLNKKFPITIIANDPTYINQNYSFTITSKDPSILEIEAPASCNIYPGNTKCSIWATSRAVGGTSVVSEGSGFASETSNLIEVIDQFVFIPSLDPSGILPADSSRISYKFMGNDLSQEDPISIGGGIDNRGGIVNGYNYCLENPLNLSYSQTVSHNFESGIIGYNIKNMLFGQYLDGLVSLFSLSKEATILRGTQATSTSINRYYGRFEIGSVINKQDIYALSQEAKDLLAVSTNDFFKYCGMAFGLSYNVGYGVLISTRLNFENEEIRNLFKNKYGINENSLTSLADLLSKIIKFKQDSSKTAELTIAVNQFGGTDQELTTLLQKYIKADGMVHCDYTNTNICNQLLKDVDDYYIKQLPENTKNKESWHIFSIINNLYYPQVPSIEPVNTNYHSASSAIVENITTDRDRYNFLLRYQNKSFWSLVDADNQAKIKELTKKYKAMIENYAIKANIIDNCMKDITSLNTSCPIAAQAVTDIRNNYANIDQLTGIGSIIYILYSGYQFDNILVPLDLDSTCEAHNNVATVPICHGKFVVYNAKENYFSNNAVCFVDTTTDKNYFNKIGHPEWSNKSVYCTFKNGIIDHTYITNFDENHIAKLGHAMSYDKSSEIEDINHIEIMFKQGLDYYNTII